MENYTQRFDNIYDYVIWAPGPIDVTKAVGMDNPDDEQSIAAVEGFHFDIAKQAGARALSVMTTLRRSSAALGTSTLIINRIEIYSDAEGGLIPVFSELMDAHVKGFSVNYGYRDTLQQVPPQRSEMALNSALIAVEQALEAYTNRG